MFKLVVIWAEYLHHVKEVEEAAGMGAHDRSINGTIVIARVTNSRPNGPWENCVRMLGKILDRFGADSQGSCSSTWTLSSVPPSASY